MSSDCCSCDCHPGSSSGSMSGCITCTSKIRGRIYAPTYVSAYSIAVQNGFDGTEEEWLLSLKGEDGRSAYQIAVDYGFEGDEEEWLASLVGPEGPQGPKGDNGKSAYEIAVDYGYEGTEEEYGTELIRIHSTLDKFGSKLDPIFEAEEVEDEYGNKYRYDIMISKHYPSDEKDYNEVSSLSDADINEICRV